MGIRTGCAGKNPCRHYSFKLQRCKLGYVNPKTIKEGTQAAMQGFLKPCPITKKGQKVIQRVRDAYDKTGPKPV